MEHPYLRYGSIALAMTIAGALVLWTQGMTALASYAISVNVTAFLMTGLDKRLARAGAPRVPELIAIGTALAGGAVGAVAGMKYFRHKIRKPRFILMLLIVIAIHALCLELMRRLGFELLPKRAVSIHAEQRL